MHAGRLISTNLLYTVYSMKSIIRSNISAELAESLRQMIADGRLVADSRINEVHLSTELGVSRTPLREALAMLVAEGALEAKPRKGTFVRALSREDFLHIYSIRPLLDVGALRMAGLPTEKTLTKLQKLNAQLAAADKTLRKIIIDDEWHLLLVAGCDNPVLIGLIEQFMVRTRRYELAYLREHRNTETVVDEHMAIMRALEQGDLEGACQALQTNLTSGVQPILDWLQQRETPNDV